MPILQALADGTLNPATLSARDREHLAMGKVDTSVVWLTAVLDSPPVVAEDLRCATLWRVGSNNVAAMPDAAARAMALLIARVPVRIAG
jgi:hypothetical protein